MPNSTFDPILAALNSQSAAGLWKAQGGLSSLLPKAGDPCLVVNAAGHIVAANERAAELLGRDPDSLQGQFFGVWGPELDHADLDLIRVRNGQVESSSVRARRFSESTGLPSQHTSIVFEHVPKPKMPLAAAIGLTTLEVPAVNLNRSFSNIPDDIHVGADFQRMIRAWVVFFRNTADQGEADLRIRTKAEPGWLEVEFCLHQPDPPPLRSGSYESDDLDLAAAAVEEMGGTFQLRVEYPDIAATLRFPQDNRLN